MGNPFIPVAPQIEDPVQQYGKMLQLRTMAQQQQMFPLQMQQQQQQVTAGQQENQMRQMQLQDQQSMRQAYLDAQGDPDKFLANVKSSKYGVSFNGIMSATQGMMQMKKTYMDMSKEQLAYQQQMGDTMQGAHDRVMQAPPARRPFVYQQELSKLGPLGQGLPPQYPGDDQFSQMGFTLKTASQMMADAGKQAETFKNTQQGNLAAAETAQKQPFTPDKIAQLNAGMQQGWQVLHPGQPLPQAYQLGPNATQADFQRLDSLMKNEVQSAATKAQRDTANAMRSSMVGFQQQMAKQGQSQRSYQFASSQLDKVGQPVEQLVQRMGRLKDTLAQANPQSDALVAPELLTVMAGGQGSGLRMNEAEISRIVGGRNAWQSLKSTIDRYQADPSKPFLITPVQRQQIGSLLTEVNRKLIAKQQVLDQARQDLTNSDDPGQHKQIVTGARKTLTQIDEGAGQTAPRQGQGKKDFFSQFGGQARQ